MSHFDERSGLVPCVTPWGSWSQTIEEIFVEVNVEKGTKSKEIKCSIKPTFISVSVAGKEIFKVRLSINYNSVILYTRVNCVVL